MSKAPLGPDLETRLYEYFQTEKIVQLYNQIVERAEKSISQNRGSEKTKGLKGEVGLGELLTQLGIKASLGGDIQSKQNTSEQVTYELTPEQKLRLVWRYLYLVNNVADLNICLQGDKTSIQSVILVRFEGKNCGFELVDPNNDPNDEHTLIRVRCLVEDYRAEFYCSRAYFSGSALIFDIKENIIRDIFGIASIKKIDHDQKFIAMNPVAF